MEYLRLKDTTMLRICLVLQIKPFAFELFFCWANAGYPKCMVFYEELRVSYAVSNYIFLIKHCVI